MASERSTAILVMVMALCLVTIAEVEPAWDYANASLYGNMSGSQTMNENNLFCFFSPYFLSQLLLFEKIGFNL